MFGQKAHDPTGTLFISGGRVGCPRIGDVSVEACYACRFIDGLDEDHQVVRCRAQGDSSISRLEIPITDGRQIGLFDTPSGR